MPVYAAFDPDDRCLYVGQSGRVHPVLRWAEHVNQHADWTTHAVRWEVLRDISEHAATVRLRPLHSRVEYADQRPAPDAGSSTSTHDDRRLAIIAEVEEDLIVVEDAWDDDDPISLD